ncbi:unnamed protein product [Aphanomyces euteiches]
MHIFVAQAKPSQIAKWHGPSVVVSMLFLVNLTFMPFVYYISDPIMYSHDYRIPWKVVANDAAATSAFRGHFTQLLYKDPYYTEESLVAMRLAIIVGQQLFMHNSIETLDKIRLAACSPTPFQSLWVVYFMGAPVAFASTWTLVSKEMTSVFFVFSPMNRSISWCIVSLLLRLAMSGYIVRRAWVDYYSHVWRHRSSDELDPRQQMDRLGFCPDLIINPGSMGVATLRVIYANDTWAILQGIVYLSRFVWFAYAAIWIGNEWNLRLTSVSTSACAWSTVVVTLLLVRFVGAVKIVFAIFSFFFNIIDMDEMLDVTICTVGAYGMYIVIPLQQRETSVTSPVLTATAISREWKQRILLWLFGFGKLSAGPSYRLVELDQTNQRFPMLRQDPSDCFLVDKSRDSIRQLCLASRVVWPSRVATSSKQKVGKKSKTDTPKTVEKAITPPLDGVYAKNVPKSANHAVYRDYDVMLNQVHISSYTSNNKFYRIQLIKTNPATYDVFSGWGRVGEDGDYKLWCSGADLKTAVEVFHKKFKDKTRSNWKDRRNFAQIPGFYDMVELDYAALDAAKSSPQFGDDSVPSELPPKTQKLIEMIFDKDMFKNELVRMNLDPKRMPLGALSLKQIEKGVAILNSTQATLAEANPSIFKLEDLSAKFYQFIPHAYDRSTIPPVLETPKQLEEKYHMLATLHDIAIAQDVEKALGETEPVMKHSVDLKYAELNSQLDLVTPDHPFFETIRAYIANTKRKCSCPKHGMQLVDIWEVRRSDEDKTFSKFDATPNHRLLWHGTNVAVVAAILKSGLRIMPSSGGRVGKGIYLANMLEKSRQYLWGSQFDGQNVACVFLVEAALGQMNEIHQDDTTITKPPTGFDSVVAKGKTHPNPDEDQVITLDNQQVRVNAGKWIKSGVESAFSFDEYLVYEESQQRLRFIVTFKL